MLLKQNAQQQVILFLQDSALPYIPAVTGVPTSIRCFPEGLLRESWCLNHPNSGLSNRLHDTSIDGVPVFLLPDFHVKAIGG